VLSRRSLARMPASLVAALIALPLTGTAPGRSDAETSSWTSATEGPAAPLPKKLPQAPASKIQSVEPQNKSAAPASGAADNNTSAFSKTATPTNSNDAYEVFDQGKYLTALELAMKAAERGEPQAHTLIGRIYGEGLGTSKNSVLAAQWYARGAELGDPEAMFAYAVMLVEGQGIAKDPTAAAKLFEAAAAKRHPLANYNLALMFLKGDGKPENPYRAAIHMRFAAEAGVVAAQYDLGSLYAAGTGVEANAFEAAKWIGKAALAGHPEAQLAYALLLFRGQGIPADAKKGVEYFRSAADKGVIVAQNRLARCYAQGAGVEVDALEAAKWHLIAKAGGLADDSLDKVLAKLSKADRLKAQQAAEEWRERAQVGIE
jgi:uncharacterized protein